MDKNVKQSRYNAIHLKRQKTIKCHTVKFYAKYTKHNTICYIKNILFCKHSCQIQSSIFKINETLKTLDNIKLSN